MLHAALDLSRTRLDYCLLDERGGRVEVSAAPPDGDGLRGLAQRVELRHGPVPVRAAIESMNGARALPRAPPGDQRRLGKQRGPKVAQVDIARRPTAAIWHMLTRNQPFAPAGAARALAA